MTLKEKYTIDYIELNNLILLKALVGSYAQNLQTEKSDKDYYGIFYLKKDDYNSLEYKINPFDTVISNNPDYDITYIEFTKFIELLYKSNPNALELLQSSKIKNNWVIKSKWIDIIDINKILSKKCFDSFGKYASSQIKKATGLNKKMNNPIPIKKKSLLNFCYIYGNKNHKHQINLIDFLKKYKIDQKFIGLKSIKNCKSTYEVYLDLHSMLCFDNSDYYKNKRNNENLDLNILKKRFNFAKFKGIVHPEQFSPQIRMSSIPKNLNNEYNIELIGYMYYNLEGFESYLKDYREYREWVDKRNPERYKNNIGQKYDVKNLAHCSRLLTMAKEIAEGKGLNIRRFEDRDYFLSIKLGKINYTDILNYTNNIINNLPEIYSKSDLRDNPDFDYLNEQLINFNNYRNGI